MSKVRIPKTLKLYKTSEDDDPLGLDLPKPPRNVYKTGKKFVYKQK